MAGERFRRRVEEVTIPWVDVSLNITISVGVATRVESDTTVSFVGRADAALHQAKEKGRNRVELRGVSEFPVERTSPSRPSILDETGS